MEEMRVKQTQNNFPICKIDVNDEEDVARLPPSKKNFE